MASIPPPSPPDHQKPDSPRNNNGSTTTLPRSNSVGGATSSSSNNISLRKQALALFVPIILLAIFAVVTTHTLLIPGGGNNKNYDYNLPYNAPSTKTGRGDGGGTTTGGGRVEYDAPLKGSSIRTGRGGGKEDGISGGGAVSSSGGGRAADYENDAPLNGLSQEKKKKREQRSGRRTVGGGGEKGSAGVNVGHSTTEQQSVEQTTKDMYITMSHHPRILEPLQNTSWKHYRRMQHPTNTTWPSGQRDLDVTRNVPRIEDFMNQKKEVTKLYEETTKQQDNSGGTEQQPTATKDEKLNIVLFYADDWTMKVLGALNPYVHTPNIDAMGKSGMIFTKNCVTTSICWISRNTLSTGVYSAVHKTIKPGHDHMFNKTISWPQTLFPLLRKGGYYTGLVGKWHAPQPYEFMKYTFDYSKMYYGAHWERRDGKKRHVTDLNQEDALDFLKRRPKDKLFCLQVAFFATHAWDGHWTEPYQPMPQSKHLYVNDTIPRPKTATEKHWNDLPWFFNDQNEGRFRWRDRFDTDHNYQEQTKNLFRMATEVDGAVGEVIKELKAQGVYDKTLLIFTTDNGNMHGEHQLAEKWYPFEESIKVPLVIQDPRMPTNQRGTINKEFTLSVDLAPTLLSAAKVPVPDFMQGRDIAELYLNPLEATKNWRQDFFYEWNQGKETDYGPFHIPAVFGLIRKDYKYFYWPQHKYEQLFHIEKDPYEEFDVLNSTLQTTHEALDVMRARYKFLKRWAQSGKPV